jgi:hypothetical protein
MSYEREVVSTVIPTAATSVVAVFPLKTDFAQPLGIRVLTAGSDGVGQLELKDADGKIFYKDAADKTYTTAIDKNLSFDDTATNLTAATTPVSALGVAIATNLGGGLATVKSPITATYTNMTAADTQLLWFYYRSHAERIRVPITIASPAATTSVVVNMPNRFVKVLGFKVTGVTDAAIRVKIADADARVVYLDSADINYTAGTFLLGNVIMADGSTTGLTALPFDATGAVGSAAQFTQSGTAVARGPLTVSVINDGTASDPVVIDLYVER